MIAALVQGELFRGAESRTAKTGKQFVLTTVRIKDGAELRFIRVVAFSESAQTDLMRLQDGDAVAVQGPLTASIYTAADGTSKVSLSIIANHVLPLRQPPKQRKPAAAPAAPDIRSRQERLAGTWSAASGDPNDDIGFGGET